MYFVELVPEDMVQIEKSKEQLYQFSGWVEEINNWKKKAKGLEGQCILSKKQMQKIQLDSF